MTGKTGAFWGCPEFNDSTVSERHPLSSSIQVVVWAGLIAVLIPVHHELNGVALSHASLSFCQYMLPQSNIVLVQFGW